MKVRFLKESVVAELRRSIRDNLPIYRDGDFNHVWLDVAYSFETEVEIDETIMAELRGGQSSENDAHNSRTMYEALQGVTPYVAADERLWVMLSHTLLLEYARSRWPLPSDDDKAEKHVRTHFFASTQRQIERDNVGSRLWWMAHLCSRVKDMQLDEALEVLLYKTDVRANVVERPTTAQSVIIFSALLRLLARSYRGQRQLFERDTFRTFMLSLNGLGGYRLLDALDRQAIDELLESVASIAVAKVDQDSSAQYHTPAPELSE